MALYHFSLKHVKRSEGHTAIAAAAYRSGEKLYDRYYGETQDYTKKGGVIMSEIMLPDYAPERLSDRETLWYEVEKHENRKDAQLAYSFDFALQNELTMEENIEIARQFIRENFIAKGMICDVAIHDPDKGEGGIPNPHVHVLAPIRPVNKDGEWGAKRLHIPVFDADGNPVLNKKGKQRIDNPFTTDWSDPETLLEWRKNWAELVNEKFAEKGLSCRIDHRSNEERGIEELPQVHEGSAVRRMEQRGIATEKGSWNRWVKKTSDAIRKLLGTLRELSEWIKGAKEEVRLMENPSVVDMVMLYYDHRNEVAETYGRGAQKAKRGNLQSVSELVAYIHRNNLTDVDTLEALIEKKKEALADEKSGMDTKKAEVAKLKKNIKLLDDYEQNKSAYDGEQKIFFKAKRHEYQEAHRPELNKFYKARRLLKEQGYQEEDFDMLRDHLTATIGKLQDEINAETQVINESAIAEEVKMLNKIKAAIDYSVSKNDGKESGTGAIDATETGAKKNISIKNGEKNTEKTAAPEQMQARLQQQTQEVQPQQNERPSFKKRLADKKEIARQNDEERRRNAETQKKRNDHSL